ncbi:MAG: NADH-quinone oxidoreductase subunit L, partial [Candidatus Thermoplasmatota archaeon]|nr:NADH-quinone oxidoreductase subunit L [Candidatus Thermoplasmatota archaeon]
ALIHAATMVNAGVYLAARTIPLIVTNVNASLFIAFIGGFTAFFAATMALANHDIKRVLAFSTISQLGYMFLGLGAAGYALNLGLAGAQEGYSAAIFHLANHSFFKALLFLGAGSVIHAVATNDMRKMGGLHKRMRITSLAMLVAALSIAGVPPLSGFWSKEGILAATFAASAGNQLFFWMWLLGILTVFMTAFYMFRLWFMTFWGKPRWENEPRESPRVMTVPLMILAVFAVGSGLVIFPLGGFGNLIYPLVAGTHAEFTAPLDILIRTFAGPSSFLTYISILGVAAGLGWATLIYRMGAISPDSLTAGPGRRALHTLLKRRYYIDDAYDAFGRRFVLGIARLSDWFDRNIVDGLVNLVARLTLWAARGTDLVDRRAVDGVVNSISLRTLRGGRTLRRGQTGQVQTYVAVIVIGAAIVLFLIQIVFPLLGVP